MQDHDPIIFDENTSPRSFYMKTLKINSPRIYSKMECPTSARSGRIPFWFWSSFILGNTSFFIKEKYLFSSFYFINCRILDNNFYDSPNHLQLSVENWKWSES